ncbi:GNAT family N-acetyltransferase [Alginatibacterium sediminis]|uniref:GNAT family N-acetyltransferase n=1 Tax=Alginatibacterium sediminis TaxID=2164068 RepID=A0A420EHX7_9ALTE|nr:GNAT family N-acetyltransferase [Alginatibacterium sediminis]RKF20293.1 GNAT family N-acetyltransferase [Alginatibacterium sediminis]
MRLIHASLEHLPELKPLVQAFHHFESIVISDDILEKVLQQLLDNTQEHGDVWLVEYEQQFVGYMAVCYSYSIEFGGKCGFIDEFYINEKARGKGLGSSVLTMIRQQVKLAPLKRLMLEVDKNNMRAKNTYIKAGFRSRNKYQLMHTALIKDV